MGFLEGLGKKVADAGQKTKGMTDVARLELLVKKEESKLNQIYSRIGKLYVDMHMDDHEEAFSGMLSEFQETTQTIRNYNQQIAQIKGGSAFCIVVIRKMSELRRRDPGRQQLLPVLRETDTAAGGS